MGKVPVPDGYYLAFLLTLLVELPVYAAGLGARGLFAGLVGNVVSHPLIFIVLPVSPLIGEPIAWAVELVIATVLIEGRRRFEEVLVTVLAANVLSMVTGLLL